MALAPPMSVFQSAGASASVLTMMEEFRGDLQFTELFEQLDDLASRVTAAENLNAGSSHLHSAAHAAALGGGGKAWLSATSSRSAAKAGLYSQQPQGKAGAAGADGGHHAGGAAGNGSRGMATAALRVEDVNLPLPPTERGAALPAPEGLQEWEALQAAVNNACSHFRTPAARSAWKRWSLTQANAALLVSLLWWLVAAVFHPSALFSEPVKDAAFHHFARLYMSEVLGFRGLNKDIYQQVWFECLTSGTVALLCGAFPRSAHKFDADLSAFLSRQLRLWTAGTLPGDLHPSAHAVTGDNATAAEFASSLYESAPTRASVSRAAASSARSAGHTSTSPAAARAAGSSHPSHQQSRSRSAHGLASDTSAANARGGGGGGNNRQGSPPGSSSSPPRSGSSPAPAPAGSGAVHVFRSTKNSPVMSKLMEEHALRPTSRSGSGLHKEAVGMVHHTRHRALDVTTEDELSYTQMARALRESTTTALTQYDKLKASNAVESAERRKQWLTDRNGADEMLDKLQQARKVKTYSDRLSGWVGEVPPNSTHWIVPQSGGINGDVPAKSELIKLLAEAGSATAARMSRQQSVLTSSAAVGGGGGGDVGLHGLSRDLVISSSASKKAMRMRDSPVYELQRLEDSVRAVLSAKPQNSADLAARLAAKAKRGAAEDTAAAKQLQMFPRGRRDIKVARVVRGIMHGMDLEQYAT